MELLIIGLPETSDGNAVCMSKYDATKLYVLLKAYAIYCPSQGVDELGIDNEGNGFICLSNGIHIEATSLRIENVIYKLYETDYPYTAHVFKTFNEALAALKSKGE